MQITSMEYDKLLKRIEVAEAEREWLIQIIEGLVPGLTDEALQKLIEDAKAALRGKEE